MCVDWKNSPPKYANGSLEKKDNTDGNWNIKICSL